MPRHARIIVPGAAVHVMQRGNNRADCFFAEQDRAFYLFHLARLLPRAQCSLHAYCLMTNHVHLLVTARDADSCAKLMKHLGQLYTQYVNRTYRRTGSLWDGRYKSCLVQSQGYLLTCYRYNELNPVRAGLVRQVADYPWSSFRANAHGQPCEFLTAHDKYVALDANSEQRRALYRGLFGSLGDPAVFDDIREATNAGYVVGDMRFKTMVAGLLGRRVERGTAGRPRNDADKRTRELFAQ
jgi:putative transposase